MVHIYCGRGTGAGGGGDPVQTVYHHHDLDFPRQSSIIQFPIVFLPYLLSVYTAQTQYTCHTCCIHTVADVLTIGGGGAYTSRLMYVCLHIGATLCLYVCMYVCLLVCVYVCVSVSVYVCLCVSVSVYTSYTVYLVQSW